MQRGREHRLRQLWRLHRAYVESDKLAVESARTAALAEQNRLKSEELALKSASHRLRFAATEHGRQALLKMVARLESELAALRVGEP